MKSNNLAFAAALWAAFLLPAHAQYVPNHAIPLGLGAGHSGFGFVGPCAANEVILGQGASANPACSGLSAALDSIGSTQGDIFYRGASAWSVLAPGTSGQVLQSGGTGANPSWAGASTVLDNLGSTRGDILYRGASGWTVLAPGTAGQVLQSGGSGADPSWGAAQGIVFASRAAAAALDLSGFTVIKTLGYAAAGDGGGATFKNVGSDAFKDASIATGTISAAGSGYTDGTYTGVRMGGGDCKNVVGTAVVSSGAVASFTLHTSPNTSQWCPAGTVMSPSFSSDIGGTGSGFTWTVSTVNDPAASFTDAGGNHWQYVEDGVINVRQFGAKLGWDGNDASATDDFLAVQAALNFAGIYGSASGDGGGYTGSTVLIPKGTGMICGGGDGAATLIVPGSTILRGVGMVNSTLKVCDSGMNSSTHIVTLCDPSIHVACFGAKLEELTIFENDTAPASGDTFVVFSTRIQQADSIQRVAIYAGLRGCLAYVTGYGGAAYEGVKGLFCTLFPGTSNNGVLLNIGSAVFDIQDLIVEAGGTGADVYGVAIFAGKVKIDNFHTEGVQHGISVNIASGEGGALLHNLSGDGSPGGVCDALVVLQPTNTSGNTVIGGAYPNNCGTNVSNGQSGGSSVTGTIMADQTFNP